MIDKVLRSLYYSLFFVTPLLMFPSTSELFEFNKIIFIYFIGVLASFFTFLKFITNGKFTFKRTRLDLPIAVFLISQILATVFSIDRHTSLFGYYGRFNGGLFSVITYLALFYLFIINFESEFVEKLLKVSLVSSFIVILWGLPGKIGHDSSCFLFLRQFNNSCWTEQFRPAERMFSTLGQPNWLGAYLAINFFMGLYFYLIKTSQGHNKMNLRGSFSWLCGGYLVLNFVGILFTRSRSALLAVILGLVLFTLMQRDLLKKLGVVFIAFLISILIFKTGIPSIDKIFNFKFLISNQTPKSKIQNPKPTFSSDVTESGDIRKIVWKGAIDLGQRYPLFGTGVETFAYSYYFVRPAAHNLTSEWDFLYNKAHNEYLNYFATAGFIGLGAYLLMLGAVISNFKFLISNQIKNHNEEILKTCLFVAWTTILVTNFFGFSTTTVNLFFYLIPGFLLLASSEPGLQKVEFHSGRIIKNAALIFVSLTTIYALFFLINYYRADIIYAKADSYFRTGDYQTAAPLFDRALRTHYEHVYQDKLAITLANLALLIAFEKEGATSAKLLAVSELLNQRALQASPQNVLYWKTRAKNHYLYYQINDDKKEIGTAIAALSQAERLAPSDPKIFYTSAILYSLIDDRENSLTKITRSINLKPDYRDGYFLRAQLEKKYGQKELARRDLEYILKNIDPKDKEAKDEFKGL